MINQDTGVCTECKHKMSICVCVRAKGKRRAMVHAKIKAVPRMGTALIVSQQQGSDMAKSANPRASLYEYNLPLMDIPL